MNKLKPGDEVELKRKAVKNLVKSIGLFYTKPESRLFETNYASEVLMLLGSYLKKTPLPVGKVKAYGARIDGEEKFLVINVKNKLGRAEGLVVLEKDVKKV